MTVVDNNIKKYQGLAAVFLFLILAGCLVGIAVPAGSGWDFANFYDTGRRVAAGQIADLYKPETLIGGEQPQGTLRFWGAPISAWLYAPLSYFSPLTALVIFKIQNTIALFTALLLLYLHNRRFVETTPAAQWRFAATLAFLCLVFQPFWTVYRVGGQTTPTVLLLLTLALLSHTRGRFLLSATFVACAVLIKPAFVTLFLFLAVVSGVQFLSSSALVFSLAGLVSLVLMGWSIHRDFLTLMLKGAPVAFPWFYNSSLYVTFVNLRVAAGPGTLSTPLEVTLTAMLMLTKLLVVATFFYLVIRSRGQKWLPGARRHFNFLLAVSFFMLISQTVWEHYLSVLFVLLAYVVATSAHFSRRAMVLVGAIFVLSMGQNLIFINLLRYNFSFDSPLALLFIGLFKSGPLLLTLIFLWRHHEELFQSYATQRWATYYPEENLALLGRKGETMQAITDPSPSLAEAAIKQSLVSQAPGSKKVKVVLFSGGRGSRVLSKELINNPQVGLTIAVNGYDDGASTGEVRRFFGDSLGPSDFRKNASRMAGELQSCSRALVELLDLRFPVGYTVPEALASFRIISGEVVAPSSAFEIKLRALLEQVDEPSVEVLARKLSHFEHEIQRSGRPFSFSDCSIGNLVFAGCFLEMERDFNGALGNYCRLLNLPPHLIENVTDGADAHLVAVDRDNRVLGSEADIVDANRRNHIKDIFLLAHPLTETERGSLSIKPSHEVSRFLEKRSCQVVANPRLLDRIAEADLIIYSPGTQHSSLFPSYLTPGLGTTIARNLTAIKLLITNIQEDAEIPDSSAVDIIDRAVSYLKEKDLRRIPTPCLITHYLLNDNRRAEPGSPYIPLGRLETLEDPRLVRIGNYEEGITGCHDAAKVLTPFIESFLKGDQPQEIAVLLLGTDSLNKISQTMLEMLRGRIDRLPVAVTVFYLSEEAIDPAFTQSLPFEVLHLPATDGAEAALLKTVKDKQFDYVVLFESSGMYKGEDIVNVAELLNHGRLDAVWGSRRLSVKDIHQSYLLRYRHKWVLGALSYLGSHLLSLAYLVLYGRYISDTLSGVRAIRASYLSEELVDLRDQSANQHILSKLLRDRAEIFETPVQFFSLSPDKVRRTTTLDGLRSLLNILRWRFQRPKAHGDLNKAGRAQSGGLSASNSLGEPKSPIAPEAASTHQ